MLRAFAGQLRSTTFQNLETRKGEKIGQTEVWREAAQIDPERPFLWPSATAPHKEVAYRSEPSRCSSGIAPARQRSSSGEGFKDTRRG
jgi:hypothetical protein